jgi:D-glycero-D-manno-heptose 1,7-bisphosphate phosphatase
VSASQGEQQAAGASARPGGRPAVFLDRDGVLTEPIVRGGVAYAPTRVEDFVLVSDAGAQVQRLRDAGFLCIVFTNQPERQKNLLSEADLDEMHRQMCAIVPLDDVYVCPHDGTTPCRCRKPDTGMIDDAAERWGIDVAASYVIGDRWRDVDAGQAAGCYSILIERSYSVDARGDIHVTTLGEAVDEVLRHREGATR